MLYKSGVPQAMYVDNGSIYASKEISPICTRLGCLLYHTPVRDGAAKGKIERFLGLSAKFSWSALSTLQASKRSIKPSLRGWKTSTTEAEHSVLKMRPVDRFGLDLSLIRFLPPNSVNDELFFVEEERTVFADNTFSLRRTRFEAPRDVRSRKIQVRFDRARLGRVVVYYMIRAHFGLDQNPFSHERLSLLRQQQEIFDTLRVHCQQGGLCLIVGEPGTGKSIIKHVLREHDPKRMLTPVVNRTLHAYHSILRILC